MKLICIRHLPTQWNKLGLLQGRQDIDILPPDDDCQQTIHQNLAYLKEYGSFDLVCVSSLKRTQQTASMYNIINHNIDALIGEGIGIKQIVILSLPSMRSFLCSFLASQGNLLL